MGLIGELWQIAMSSNNLFNMVTSIFALGFLFSSAVIGTALIGYGFYKQVRSILWPENKRFNQ